MSAFFIIYLIRYKITAFVSENRETLLSQKVFKKVLRKILAGKGNSKARLILYPLMWYVISNGIMSMFNMLNKIIHLQPIFYLTFFEDVILQQYFFNPLCASLRKMVIFGPGAARCQSPIRLQNYRIVLESENSFNQRRQIFRGEQPNQPRLA